MRSRPGRALAPAGTSFFISLFYATMNLMEAFFRKIIFLLWIEWYFFDVPRAILRGWGNFLKFNLNYFSVPVLLKTFLSPWRRYSMSYGKRFDPGKFFEAFTFNMMSRGIGAVLRIFFIVIGVSIEIFIFLAGAITFLAWLISPIILIGGFFYGFTILF